LPSRFQAVREALKLNKITIAKELDIPQPTVSDMENGKLDISKKTIKKLVSRYGVNANWLLTGEGEMFLGGEPEDKDDFPEDPEQGAAMLDHLLNLLIKKGLIEESDIPPPLPGVRRVNYADKMTKETYRMLQRQLAKAQREAEHAQKEAERIEKKMARYEAQHSESDEASEPAREYEPRMELPLLEVVAAGEPLESLDTGETYSVPLSRLHGNPERYFAVRVRGESMKEAGIYDDSIVVIRKEVDLINGKIYLFRREGEYTLKRYRLRNDMKPKLLYEDGTGREVEMYEGEDWEVVGVFCFAG